MCVWLGAAYEKRIGLGFTNLVGVLDVCLCLGCDGVGGGQGACTRAGRLVLYLCEL